jgi:peptidoglycan/xylan/chitin deacetylase (PgdA/CDA1 family)
MRYVFMRYPGGVPKAVTFSYDDGVPQDKRLAELFDKYGLKGTFNFNCLRLREDNYTNDEIQEYFLSKGHEIAVHGDMHRAPGKIRTIEGIRDVLNCRLELEERCGEIIRGMAYPDSGITSIDNFSTYEKIKEYLCELDIAYARTLGGDNDAFLLPQDFHRWMPTAHHNNPKIMEYVDKFIAIDYSEGKCWSPSRVPRLFYLWGHSYEFDKQNNWDHIESICEKLSGKSDIWYATNIEIYDYVQGYRRLVYSANGCKVYNPNLFPIWIDVDGDGLCINPGQTVVIAEE